MSEKKDVSRESEKSKGNRDKEVLLFVPFKGPGEGTDAGGRSHLRKKYECMHD